MCRQAIERQVSNQFVRVEFVGLELLATERAGRERVRLREVLLQVVVRDRLAAAARADLSVSSAVQFVQLVVHQRHLLLTAFTDRET